MIIFTPFTFLLFCFITLFPLSGLAHGEDANFKTNYKKIVLDEGVIKTLGIETEIIKETNFEEIIQTTGQIEEIPNNHFEINTPVQGIVTNVLVNIGDNIKIDEPLVTIKSTEISRLQSDINQLKAEFELAKNNHEREKNLFEKGITAKKDFEVAEAVLKGVTAKLQASESNLGILTENITSDTQGTFIIKSKKHGVISERTVTNGQAVNINQVLLKGADLSTVWVNADIYEKDVNKIKSGQKATIIIDGTNGKHMGKVTHVGAVINSETRTLPVKITVNNQLKDPALKSGLFTQVLIQTNSKRKTVVIPRTALVERDKEGTEGKHEHLVYIKKGDKFIPRKIQVESHDSNSVEVLSGLKAGDIFVTNGAYQLQYGKGEGSHAEKHGHEHEKQNKGIPIWRVIGISIFGLFIGILIGKRKKSNS